MQGLKAPRKRRRDIASLEQSYPAVGAKARQMHADLGPRNKLKHVGDKKLRRALKTVESKAEDAAVLKAEAEVLVAGGGGYLEAEGLERTYKFKQRDLVPQVDVATQAKVFNLDLRQHGPYTLDYGRSGRFLMLGGRRGHVALVDLLRTDLVFELNVNEEVRDVQCLHNETLVAVAQQKYVYIYDHTGLEVHCLRKHIDPLAMTFLPYHFLLASVGRAGYLKYQDVSTGQLVAEWRTRLGPCDVLAQNPSSGVLHLGHSNGTVTLWSPTVSSPLVRMLAHRGPVRCVTLSDDGNYMATSGGDGQLKIWDVRKFSELHAYRVRSPPRSLAMSQTGLLGVGFGSGVQVWKDAVAIKAAAPYLNHDLEGAGVQAVQFRPYEDIFGMAHGNGFSSIVVPGAGEANFDSFTANPFQSRKERREQEVRALLEKLQPETIVLDQESIGAVSSTAREVQEQRRQEAEAANQKPKKEKKKARGRNKIGKRLRRKQRNVIDEEKVKLLEQREEASEARKTAVKGDVPGLASPGTGDLALRRFQKK